MHAGVRFVPSIVAVLLSAIPSLAPAAGVVGTGTPESCTEFAFGVALGGGGSVTFDCGPAPHAIILTVTKPISSDVQIDGGGLITLSGGNATPHFQVFNGVTALLDDLTLALGNGAFGSIQNFGTLTIADSRIENCAASGDGGAISNFGTLYVIEGSVITGNEALDHGGAIYNEGGSTVTVTDSEISSNVAGADGDIGDGGGIFDNGGALSISGATIRDNEAESGGGISSAGTLSLTSSLIEENLARAGGSQALGGGLYVSSGTAEIASTTFNLNDGYYGAGMCAQNDAVVTIEDSTFTGNDGVYSGAVHNTVANVTIQRSLLFDNGGVVPGIYSSGALSLTNVTITNNVSLSGAAVEIASGPANLRFVTISDNFDGGGLNPTATTSIRNSILDNNLPVNCVDSFHLVSQGFNISNDTSCGFADPSDEENVDPLLQAVADNGGPTLTQLPGAGSIAIDGGQCIFDVTDDQRGVARPQGLACDVGAVERSPDDVDAPGCGDPVALTAARGAPSGHDVTASDALAILNASVGLFTCELCVCDVDSSGAIAATDALATLRAAVGLGTTLTCPACS